MVFGMSLQVFCQLINAGREDGNLHFCRTRVRIGLTKLLNEFSLLFFRDQVRTSLD